MITTECFGVQFPFGDLKDCDMLNQEADTALFVSSFVDNRKGKNW